MALGEYLYYGTVGHFLREYPERAGPRDHDLAMAATVNMTAKPHTAIPNEQSENKLVYANQLAPVRDVPHCFHRFRVCNCLIYLVEGWKNVNWKESIFLLQLRSVMVTILSKLLQSLTQVQEALHLSTKTLYADKTFSAID